jgi:hypothetical protein
MTPDVTPPGHFIPRHISVVDHSSKIAADDIAFHIEAVNIQIRKHAAPLWDGEPPGVSFVGPSKVIPSNPAIEALLGYVNDDGDADAAGYHSQIGNIVYGLIDVGQSDEPSVTHSHEALEMYANARLNRKVPGPKNRSYYVELCDPTQRQTYKISVTLFGKTREIEVSDFVLPKWFGLNNPDGSDKTTYLDQNLAPFVVAPGGYQIAEEADGEIVFLSGGSFGVRSSKHSRTSRIMTRS